MVYRDAREDSHGSGGRKCGGQDARCGAGHRLRLQVAGGAHPRFARNPGNGQVDAPALDFMATRYSIGLSAENPSALVVSQTDRKAAAHA